jgi:hypothetical protein
MTLSEHELLKAHKRSIYHRVEIENSQSARCFYCLDSFKPSEILDWTDDKRTAICPRCGIDSVIGDASGVQMNDEFFRQMHWYWFER